MHFPNVPWRVPSGAHWPTAKSTGLAPSQRRGRVRLLLRTPLCSGIRWYFRASIKRSLHSEWWRTSSSVSTLLIRKSRLSRGSRTHFISWWDTAEVIEEGGGNKNRMRFHPDLPKAHAACVRLCHVSPRSARRGTPPPLTAHSDYHWRSGQAPEETWQVKFSFTTTQRGILSNKKK